MTRHDSERVVGRITRNRTWDRRYVNRIDPCPSCFQVHGRISYAHSKPSPDGPSLAELAVGVLVLLTWFVALFWALPVIATTIMEGGA